MNSSHTVAGFSQGALAVLRRCYGLFACCGTKKKLDNKVNSHDPNSVVMSGAGKIGLKHMKQIEKQDMLWRACVSVCGRGISIRVCDVSTI